MKALIISDTHGMHKYWERLFPMPDNIDMIIHGGDLTNVGAIHEMNHFMYWFKNLDIEHKIMIAGNHDLGLDNYNRYAMLDMIQGIDGLHYLEDSGVEIEGIKFWGSPVTPPFMNWSFMREPEDIVNHWDMTPNDTDILITHGPAQGILDWVDYGGQGSVGCPELLEAIERVKPKYHIFGHIHEMYGIREVGETTHICASILDGRYHPTRPGHIIEL